MNSKPVKINVTAHVSGYHIQKVNIAWKDAALQTYFFYLWSEFNFIYRIMWPEYCEQ